MNATVQVLYQHSLVFERLQMPRVRCISSQASVTGVLQPERGLFPSETQNLLTPLSDDANEEETNNSTDGMTIDPDEGDSANGIAAKTEYDEASADTGPKLEGATLACESLTCKDVNFVDTAVSGDFTEVSASQKEDKDGCSASLKKCVEHECVRNCTEEKPNLGENAEGEATEAAKGGSTSDTGSCGPSFVLSADSCCAKDSILHTGICTEVCATETDCNCNNAASLCCAASEELCKVECLETSLKSKLGTCSQGIALLTADPGVPADSGGTDGSTYTLESLRNYANYFLEAAKAGQEAEAEASDADSNCECTLSGSKQIIEDLRCVSAKKHFAGVTAEGIAIKSALPGVPADSGEGTEGSAYTLETVNKYADQFLQAIYAGDKAQAKATETDSDCCCTLSLTKLVVEISGAETEAILSFLEKKDEEIDVEQTGPMTIRPKGLACNGWAFPRTRY